jgi:hypothetical protein
MIAISSAKKITLGYMDLLCTTALRYFAYGAPRITYAWLSPQSYRFCRAVVAVFGPHYFRAHPMKKTQVRY